MTKRLFKLLFPKISKEFDQHIKRIKNLDNQIRLKEARVQRAERKLKRYERLEKK